ncbi:MAG TPA: YhjD/YihY/BrkB family envelope integrity protein [Candidatus Binataceae bacterium]|nr:YhjD/YihY/BrkB family envelope integrity protein [Candidatus Binataceae bacterium]
MAQDFLSGFIERMRADDSPLSRVLESRTAGVLRRCVDGFQRDNNLLWASALTYTTGLSIVPILAVALSALNGLGGAQAIRPLLEHYLTANSPEITDRLMSFVSNVNAKTLGAVGAAALLFTVVLTLGTVEQALNNIFRVVYGRTMARKFADYLSMTFAVPVLLASALGVRQILINRVPNLSGAGWISSSLAVWAGFLFLYVFFPNRRVRFEAAAVGALVASILLQFAQWAFIYFQYGVNRYAAIYGALASIPVLLTWIYMTWVIVLLGAEVTAAFERRNQPLVADPWATSERVVALAVALRLGERMAGRSGVVTPATLSSELGIDEAVLVEVLRRLEHGGVVIETAGGDGGQRGLFLARDASTIGLGEVLECVRGGGGIVISSDARVAAMVERLRQAERETLGGLTVRDLIERTASAAAAATRDPEGQRAADQA